MNTTGNAKRAEIRSNSHCSNHVTKSLQSCNLRDNKMVLEKCLTTLKDPTRINNIKSLLYILDVLMSMSQYSISGHMRETAYVTFQEAFEIYLSFSKHEKLRLRGTYYFYFLHSLSNWVHQTNMFFFRWGLRDISALFSKIRATKHFMPARKIGATKHSFKSLLGPRKKVE